MIRRSTSLYQYAELLDRTIARPDGDDRRDVLDDNAARSYTARQLYLIGRQTCYADLNNS